MPGSSVRGSQHKGYWGGRGAAAIGIALVLAALLLFARPTSAQKIARLGTDLEGEGTSFGAFRVFPRLTLDNYYDDNIFASEDDEKGDYIASIIPRLGAESTWSRHYLSMNAAGRFNRYADETNEDNDEYAIDVQGRLDLSEGSSSGAVFRQGRHTLGRANSENSGRRNPQQLDYFEGELSYEHRFVHFDVNLEGFADRLDFVDSRDDDRDRNQFGGAARLVRRFSPAFAAFVEPGAEVRDYDRTVDDDGFERNSVSIGGLLGVEFDVTSIIGGKIAVGPVYVDFDESSFDHVTTAAAFAEITWDVTRLTRLGAEFERRVLPTDVRGASSKIQNVAMLDFRHQLLSNLLLLADAAYFREEFEELGRTDDNYRVRAGAEYNINRFFSIVLKYTYRVRNSDFSTREFRRNRVTMTLDVRL